MAEPETIQRGKTQILFNFMPGSLVEMGRSKSSVLITRISGRDLKGINQARVLKRISKEITTYSRKHQFPDNLNEDTIVILEPQKVEAELFPLTFFCRLCKTFTSYPKLEYLKDLKCRTPTCSGGKLQQIDFIYACECGYLGPLEPSFETLKKAKAQNFNELKNRLTYELDGSRRHIWRDKKSRNRIEIGRICPECKKHYLQPASYRKTGIYISRTLSLIDLIENEIEKNIEHPDVSRAIVADYLGYRDNHIKINKLIQKAILDPDSESEDKADLEAEIEILIDDEGYSREEAEKRARRKLELKSPKGKLSRLIRQMENELIFPSDFLWDEVALNLFEYNTVMGNAANKNIEDAVLFASMLSSAASPELFLPTKDKFNFDSVIACADIPMLTLAFGFSRQEYRHLAISAFPFDEMFKDQGKRPVYGTKHHTEGVIFNINKSSIVNWLLRNQKYFGFNPSEKNLSTTFTEEQIKAWLLTNTQINLIESYREIQGDRLTRILYTLLHTMAHCYIAAASELCGLEKSSLSEYLFPQLGAFLIYCHSSSQSNLGAMFNLFQAHIDKWMELAAEKARACLNDPICLDKYQGACFACMHLNEICCAHGNYDLNRGYLSGLVEKDTQNRLFGFWEA